MVQKKKKLEEFQDTLFVSVEDLATKLSDEELTGGPV